MVMLSPAVQMPVLTGTGPRLPASAQYISAATAAATALQPTLPNIGAYRWSRTNTYVINVFRSLFNTCCYS